MNLEKLEDTSVEWYTPPEIIRVLGVFDLDPCTSDIAWNFNNSADKYYTKEQDGMSQKWRGRIWLNPPYSKPLLWDFMEKMASHNNGIALLFNRTDSHRFHDVVFKNATAILFLYNRIKFYLPNGKQGASPCAGNILIAFGESNAEVLRTCGLKGKYVRINE